ncbi:MAG: M1 family metallopeptidase [Candidatus Marinimicrobia bacterium]|jgi:aminopeptidase N|nr:M1 family metallopeptidase [Candidatus Neomarinimicrobiota bacterium]MBT3937653.1 M1 family metallopeptidase [Candidatus Neomarinimicrobiota bacterium]MBT3962367.1 M1 family metallopeptidase [Candidatus Neomarinimicrobiota bacterium]MBT4383510.1 M1 family metallopeptidase [Candidatus Neomarinimicrobiota bacterium]MBT4635589.1 M1 family metallopeptidase [Candidatus Neomarinimicrobiota bacterium]
MYKKLIIAIYVSSICFSMDIYSGGRLTKHQRNMDVKSYSINLSVDTDNKAISGFVDISFNIKDTTKTTIEVDLIESYSVEKVLLNNNSIRFNHRNNIIRIKTATLEPLNIIRIFYNGKPPAASNPPWDGGFTWETDSLGYPWVGISCQTNGAHIWFPCIEHPSDEADSAEIIITVDKPLVVGANGLLIDSTSTNNQTTWHWKTQNTISPYNINFTIGRFNVVEKTLPLYEQTLLQYFVLPEHEPGSDYIIKEAEKYLHFYESVFGPYPWSNEKFGMIETPYWGMEHQTIIAYGNNYKVREPGYDFLLLHEMGHEWWGNFITVHDWADFWIHEGITIYAEALFLEETFGKKAYHEFFQNTVRGKISNKKPIVPKRNATSFNVGGLDVYYKGAMMLHMLRYLEGKDVVLKILTQLLYSKKELPNNHTSTNEFIDIVNRMTGKDYHWFFNVYLRSKRLPKLITKNRDGKKSIYWDNQSFKMPIEIKTSKGEIIKHQPKKNKKVDAKEIDPNNWILYRD